MENGDIVDRQKVRFDKQKATLLEIPMPVGNRDKIVAFLRQKKNEGLSYTSQTNYVNTLIIFCREISTDFDDISATDIDMFIDFLSDYTYVNPAGKIKRYAESSIRQHKVLLRAFIEYLGDMGKDAEKKAAMAHLCKMLVSRSCTRTSRLPEDILTKDEVLAMVKSADQARDQAIIATLYESGARIGEFLSCNINHVTFDVKGCVLLFPNGKTGARRIRLVEAQPYLRAWLRTHPRQDEKDAPLWCLLYDEHTRCSSGAIEWALDTAAQGAGITKPVNPHAFRHARATYLAKHLKEPQMREYFGWSAGSNMPSIYVHLSGRDLDDALLKMNGLETEEDEKEKSTVRKCPRCEQLTPVDFPCCGFCGMPLSEDAIAQLDYERAVAEQATSDHLETTEYLQDLVKKAVAAELQAMKYKQTEN